MQVSSSRCKTGYTSEMLILGISCPHPFTNRGKFRTQDGIYCVLFSDKLYFEFWSVRRVTSAQPETANLSEFGKFWKLPHLRDRFRQGSAVELKIKRQWKKHPIEIVQSMAANRMYFRLLAKHGIWKFCELRYKLLSSCITSSVFYAPIFAS